MSITVVPVTPSFAAEIGDVDLSKPLSDADFEEIRAGVLEILGAGLPRAGRSRRSSTSRSRRASVRSRRSARSIPRRRRRRYSGAFADISNLNAEGKIWGETSRQRMYKAGNKLWHTDSSFKRLPSLCSLLYSRTIAPIGGHTEFADQRAAYDALPDATKRKLHGLVAEHWIVHSRRRSGFTEFNEDEMRRLPAGAAGAGAHAFRRRAASRSTSLPTPGASTACRTRKAAR